MAYFETNDGWQEDALVGGEYAAIEVHNVSLSGGASVQRGELICAANDVWSPVASADDASKPLAIACSDFTADSIQAVTQAYKSGVFNREKIICGAESASLSVDTFEQSLRTQNIRLTSMKEN